MAVLRGKELPSCGAPSEHGLDCDWYGEPRLEGAWSRMKLQPRL